MIFFQGISYDHVEMNLYVNGNSLNCPVTGVRGTVFPVVYGKFAEFFVWPISCPRIEFMQLYFGCKICLSTNATENYSFTLIRLVLFYILYIGFRKYVNMTM